MATPVTLTCPKCGRVVSSATFDPSKRYKCPKEGCGGLLEDRAEAPTVAGVAPPEVAKAAGDPKNRFGKYVLVRELGRGGMGAVHQTWDTSLKRWVALKFLLLAGSDEDLKRFHREAETAASLKHPNIAAIYEVGEIDGKPFIAMEFVEGRTLSGQDLGVRRACQVVRDVAKALEYAHARSIIHRDLKPGNILLSGDGRPVVLDFGLAKSLKDYSKLTVSGMVVGTPCYMAPEQAAGRAAQIGPLSDVYQLGAVLFELVTGRAPYLGSNPADTLRRVLDEDLPRPSSLAAVPGDVETVILRAMEKDPARRYPSARALAEDLDRALRGRAIVAKPQSAVARLLRAVRRHKVAALGTALALVVAVAAFAVLLQRESRRADLAGHLRTAAEHYGREQYQRALELYSRALELDRENAEVRRRLDECRAQIERISREARAEKEKGEARARAMEASRPDYQEGMRLLEAEWRNLYRQGADLVKMRENLKAAVDAFTRSLGAWPDNPDALFGRGRARALRFEVEEADRDLGRAVDLRPDFAAAKEERGRLLLQRHTDARLNLGWEWDADVEKPYAPWKAQARALTADGAFVAFADGRLEECLRLCDARLKEKPEQEELWKLQGDALFFGCGTIAPASMTAAQDAMSRAALKAYGEAIRLRPNYYEARMMRGNVLLQRGDAAGALADVRVAHQLRPDDAMACWFMGRTASDPKESLEWYEKGLRVNPNSFACRMNRASALGQMGQLAEAREELERSMGLNPAHYYPLYLRGSIRSKSGEMEAACEDFRAVVAKAPAFQSAWYNLGATACNLRKWREGIDALERALALGHPDSARIKEILRSARRNLGE